MKPYGLKMKPSIKVVVFIHNGILTLIESGYSVFLLKIPLSQGVYGTFNDFEAEFVELNSILFSFHFAKTDTRTSEPVKFMGIPVKFIPFSRL